MSYDDESDVSASSAEYLESPNKAKMKALKAKLEKKGLKDAAKQNDLKALKLAMLKSQVADDKKQPKDDNPAKANASIGTKTREQEIQAGKLSADAKPTAEKLVSQGSQDKKADQELKKDEVQSEEA